MIVPGGESPTMSTATIVAPSGSESSAIAEPASRASNALERLLHEVVGILARAARRVRGPEQSLPAAAGAATPDRRFAVKM